MTRSLSVIATGVLLAAGIQPTRAQSPSPEQAHADLASVYNYVRIDDRLATSGQIAYDQIESLKAAGYEVVINLATANESANALEGFLAVQAGLSYIHIPVSWSEPAMRDLEMFFDVMKANAERRVYVHCFANMRASAFTYLYRTLVAGEPDDAALIDMHEVWDPQELEQWAALIERARAHHEQKSQEARQ